jgi:hypothetical protein
MMNSLGHGNFCLFLLACAWWAALAFGGTLPRQSREAAGQRLRPPASLNCPRDHLTSFTGRVLYFHRATGRTIIRVHTDENTREQFRLRHPGTSDPSKWFLLRGEPFKPDDWKLIESARNQLRPNLRATMWVCDDGSNPVIDWRPPEQ